MKQNTSVHLLHLPREAQLLICEKMDNRELIRMASTCRDVNALTERYTKMLSSRPNYGGLISLKAEDGKLEFRAGLESKRWSMVVEHFHEKKALFSVDRFDLHVYDRSLIPQLLDTVRNWNMDCSRIECDEYIPPETVIELSQSVRSAKWVKYTYPYQDVRDVIDIMIKSGNSQVFYIFATIKWFENDIFKHMKDLYGFGVSTDRQNVLGFFTEMISSYNTGNLKEFTFTFEDLIFPWTSKSFTYLPHDKLLPGTMLLFDHYQKIDNHMCSTWKILYVPISKDSCALIEDKILDNITGEKEVNVSIRPYDEDEILDYLIATIGIKQQFYQGCSRKYYFKLNANDRVRQLVKLFDQRREENPL